MQIDLINDKRKKLKICCLSLDTYPAAIPGPIKLGGKPHNGSKNCKLHCELGKMTF